LTAAGGNNGSVHATTENVRNIPQRLIRNLAFHTFCPCERPGSTAEGKDVLSAIGVGIICLEYSLSLEFAVVNSSKYVHETTVYLARTIQSPCCRDRGSRSPCVAGVWRLTHGHFQPLGHP
jgi:hypothetical protein